MPPLTEQLRDGRFLQGIESSITGQLDTEEGGGFADQAQDFFISTGDPETDDFIVSGPLLDAHDYFVEGSVWGQRPDEYPDDTKDLPGAGLYDFGRDPSAATAETLGDTYTFLKGDWDFQDSRNNPDTQDEGRWILYALIGGVALFLLAPLLNFGSSVLEATT